MLEMTQEEIESVESLVASTGKTPEQMIAMVSIKGITNNYIESRKDEYLFILTELAYYIGDPDLASSIEDSMSDFEEGVNPQDLEPLLSSLPILGTILSPSSFDLLNSIIGDMIVNIDTWFKDVHKSGYELGIEMCKAKGCTQ